MKHCQAETRYYYHRTLKYHECHFVVGQMTVETPLELGDTESASDEDEKGSNRSSWIGLLAEDLLLVSSQKRTPTD